eukprot:3556226-Prymnesium_polylepis.1
MRDLCQNASKRFLCFKILSVFQDFFCTRVAGHFFWSCPGAVLEQFCISPGAVLKLAGAVLEQLCSSHVAAWSSLGAVL